MILHNNESSQVGTEAPSLLDNAYGELHRAAMERAVLLDENLTVNGDDVMLGESLLQLLLCSLVKQFVAVRRHQHSPVEDEEVGLGGRKSLPFLVIALGSHGQGDEFVGFLLQGAETP